MPNQVKQALTDLARVEGSDWISSQPVWLGNLSGVVETGTPGRFYARQANSQVITVSNAAKVPPTFDLHVLVRRSRIQPQIWQITEILEDYDVPADSGLIAGHHEQHEEEGFDRLTLDRKQIKQLSCRVSATWKVQVFGATVPTATGIALIDHEEIDLSSYVITAGAKFVGIETNDSGTLSVHDGTVFGAIAIATAADIPVPDPGKYLLAYVQFYEGQTELVDSDVRVMMPLPLIPKTVAFQIHEATAKTTPANGDEFALADSAASWVIKKVTWANIKATLKTYFDTLYSALGHSHSAPDASVVTYTPSTLTDWTSSADPGEVDDGLDQLASRVKTLEGAGSSVGHTHAVMRWASSGGATFDLPDIAEYIEFTSDNGSIVDPSTVSLSSDRTQVVFDSSVTAGHIVTANYVLAQV